MFGLLTGQVGWALTGLLLIIAGLRIAGLHSWMYRLENYPEHAITKEWNDDSASYDYSYKYYGRIYSTGDEKWARKTAAHYGIEMPIDEISEEESE